MNYEKLEQYVQQWKKIEGIKPINEAEFISEFSYFLQTYPDEREIDFQHDGAYFGKQISIQYGSQYGYPKRNLCFEIAYSQDKICVYRADHEGFWTPCYLEMDKSHDGFDFIHSTLYSLLCKTFGMIL